jgi:hypothetical protein
MEDKEFDKLIEEMNGEVIMAILHFTDDSSREATPRASFGEVGDCNDCKMSGW